VYIELLLEEGLLGVQQLDLMSEELDLAVDTSRLLSHECIIVSLV
jgi:hypothetical protein